MINSTLNLIELRRHYENLVAQSHSQAAQAKEQLAHIDALLVDGLLQAQESPVFKIATAPTIQPASSTPALSSQAKASETRTELSLNEDVEDFLDRAKSSSPRRASLNTEPVTQGNRSPRPLLPAYQGLKRLEAIASVLQTDPGQEVTVDNLIPALFGNLSNPEHKAERLKLKTLLYQGEKLGRWQKGLAPSSYRLSTPHPNKNLQSTTIAIVKSPTPSQSKAPAANANAITLLRAYAGMNKLEAIAQVLSEQSGHVLHQDTIFQLLYGEVSPEILSTESKRMRASLFQGVTKGLWEKATTQPSSYLAKASHGRKPKSTPAALALAKPGLALSSSANTESNRSTPVKNSRRGRTQVLSLPVQYAGLSKLETVAKVLQENSGTVMHIDEIIEYLYGKLSGEDLKAEKVRMKDVMTRGVQRKLWNKAQGVPSSIIAGEPKQRRTTAEKSSTTAKVTKLKPALPKKPRNAASARTTAKPKRKTAEVIALLKKANIKV